MKINDIISDGNSLTELEQWGRKQTPLFEGVASAEKLSKSLLQKAVDKFKRQSEPSEEKSKEMQDYMDKLELKLGTEKVEKTTLQKFFGFFRKHPKMIGLGVMILILLSPLLPSIAVIGLSLEKILSMILAGLYAMDIASPAVKTAMEL
jgi:hypothetical protein|tara:strand:+ start:626 stop:1072 length:447 start_codon:yes stop_codon:yes gene_type:complete